jgi:tetratricopeptide (TPR) repeat protein
MLEAAYEADPADADAVIWLGRRLAYLGRYRGAIRAFGEGIRRHPGDARLYRHRGHRYITVRELNRAIEDLEHAARLIGGQDDVVEPDGQPNAAGVPRSTLHTNIRYHLGLARYVAGDFRGAAHAFRQGFGISPNDGIRVAMADWLWLSLTRLGRTERATDLLDEVLSGDLEIIENEAYRRRLGLYRGDLPPDSLLPPGADALAVATYGYGLGTWHLIRGDTVAARAIYDDLMTTGYWPAFGYLAAEAELARLGEAR